MGDRGVPASWREMNGYGSHTYMWINAAGEKSWVKYHFHSDQGVRNLTQEAANEIAGEDADFHRRDLYDAIEDGELPVVDAQRPGDALRGRQDLPLQPVRPDQDLAAQRLPADQGRHDDAEQEPGQLLRADRAGRLRAQRDRSPASRSAPTRCCSGRVFSYADTQRYRIGPNYQQLPVNRHRVEGAYTYQFDGPMAYDHTATTGRSTHPTPTATPYSDRHRRSPRTAGRSTVRWSARPTPCARTTTTSARPAPSSARSGTTPPRERFVNNVAGHILGGVKPETLPRVFEYWKNVDADTGKQIEEAVHAGPATRGSARRADRASRRGRGDHPLARRLTRTAHDARGPVLRGPGRGACAGAAPMPGQPGGPTRRRARRSTSSVSPTRPRLRAAGRRRGRGRRHAGVAFAPGRPTRRAVLHVHGFADYFFQTAGGRLLDGARLRLLRPRPPQVRPLAAPAPDPQLRHRPRRPTTRSSTRPVPDRRSRRPRPRRRLRRTRPAG